MLSMDVHNIEDLGQRIYHVCVLHGKCVVVVVDDVDGSLEGVTYQFRLTNMSDFSRPRKRDRSRSMDKLSSHPALNKELKFILWMFLSFKRNAFKPTRNHQLKLHTAVIEDLLSSASGDES